MHDIWNPWHGCIKISPGCKNCYMYCLDKRRGISMSSNTIAKTKNFEYPLSKDRYGNYIIKPGERIRVNMTSDTFLEEADKWRIRMWEIIKIRSDVIFWLLTKRPERILANLPNDWGNGYNNVSLNCTCENQDMFTKRWQIFKQIPAKHKGLCLAPLISDIDITPALQSGQIEEISLGGENYDNPRPLDIAWVKNISDQCKIYKTNFCWYESGTQVIQNGILHTIKSKSMQAKLPFAADLNHKFYDIKWDLYYENGTYVPDNERYVPIYNASHCMCCSNQDMCNGCDPECPNGKGTKRIDKNTLKHMQTSYLKDLNEIAEHRIKRGKL